MNEWWGELTGVNKLFWALAIIFSVLFIIQFVFSVIGLDFDGDSDVDSDMDVDADDGYSLDRDFSILSIRSIIAFFTFFGWGGVLSLQGGSSLTTTLIFSSVSGFVAMFLVAYMMYSFSRLSQAGNIDIGHAIMQIGEVYLTIPGARAGEGLVHVKIEDSLRELGAVTDGQNLPTGSKVRVLDVLEGNLLLVEPLEL